MMNKTNAMDEKWDYLIILDACRYDFFQRFWKKYFPQGELSKIITVGTSTTQWRDNTFKEYYNDIIYISANPFISSLAEVRGFHAKNYFVRVYNLWLDGWDKQYGTVLPQTVTKTAIDAISRHPEKRFIIHYLQPHAPYIGLNAEIQGFSKPDAKETDGFDSAFQQYPESTFRHKLLKSILPFFKKRKLLGDQPEWIIKEFLLLPPATPMDAVRRKLGKKGLRNAYRQNLNIVLEQVALLTEQLSGKIVISADHGELLGENNCYMHTRNSTKPQLAEVPWLVIHQEKSKKNDIATKEEIPEDHTIDDQTTTSDPNDDIQNQITEKLKALGYFE